MSLRARCSGSVACTLLLACAGQGAAPGRPGSAEPGRAPTTASTKSPLATQSETPSVPELPEGIVLQTERSSEGIALVIQNRSSSEVQLAQEAGIQRVAGAEGTSAGTIGQRLRLDCAPDAPACFSLVPGAELHAPPWPGALAKAQCPGGDARAAAPTGRYVMRVRGCNAGLRDSAPFEVP